tara:strand:- start:267 stop:677 length:411 start_codon:yes stop_codon:yes gene_type:complete
VKKLLIVLLFFGFSFSQDKSDLIGTWKKFNVNQSYIFLGDNSGYYIFESTDDLKSPIEFDWKIITSKTKGQSTLILEYKDGFREKIVSFIIDPSENITPEYIKHYRLSGKWDGGDILIWWDSTIKQPEYIHIFEKF